MTRKKLFNIGVLLIIISISLAGYNIYSDYRAEKMSENLLKELTVGEGNLPEIENDMKIPVKNVDGVDIIGHISIPKLDKDLPVTADWNYELMNKYPNRYSGEKFNDPLIIMAHNFKSHFGGLRKLKKGDDIEFTDVLGRKIKYRVDIMEVIDGYDIDTMKNTDYDLTLFTCTLDRTARFTIRANRIN